VSVFGTSQWGAATWGAAPFGGNFPAATGDQTVNPTAIASQQATGTPYIVIPGLNPAAIASQQALGMPTMSAPSTVNPAFIPSPRAIGSPGVVGPIYPAAIPSQQNMGTPFIQPPPQEVDPTAIASMQSMGTPMVNYSTAIAPSAIPSQQAMGEPTMKGGPNQIRPTAIASQQSMGIPAIGGGSTALVVTVGGNVWPNAGSATGVLSKGGSDTAAPVSYESPNPPTITSQTLGRWTLQIDLFDDTGNYTVAVGQTVVITEGGYTLFAGCVQTIQYSRLMGTVKAIIWHVTATDKSGICDRRIIPVTTFVAGTDIATGVILPIVQNYLNGEGITTTSLSVPTDGSLGTLSADLTFNYDTVTDAFNQLGTLSGTIWYVDPTGVLWFNSFNNLPAAPWGLVENGGNFRSLIITPTNIAYANKIYAVSNLTTLPGSGSSGGGGGGGTGTGSTTETYIMTVGNIGVLTLLDGTTISGVSTALPIGTLYSITVDLNNQTVVEITQWSGQQPNFGTADFGPWFWTSNTTNVLLSVPSGALFPIDGATLVINYTPFTSNTQASVGEALTPVDPATGDPLGTCGSGLYELAIQVQNVSSVADLNAIAVAELVRRGKQVQITFQTDKPGLLPGQILNVNIPNLFLNNVNFLITQMQGVAAAEALEFGSRFQWQVTASLNEDPGNWFQWYANLLNQAANPLPVPNYEDANFILAPGSSLAGGNPAVNPYIVKNTGKLLVMFAAAQTPPVNQDLVIFFYVNGTRIPGQVTIPGSSTPNTAYVYQFPTTNPLYVFNSATENDIITIGVSYNVTGSNPTPASNVSATLRWTM